MRKSIEFIHKTNTIILVRIIFHIHFIRKITKFELSHQKKVLDECSSTLEYFLVKYVHISIFQLMLYLAL